MVVNDDFSFLFVCLFFSAKAATPHTYFILEKLCLTNRSVLKTFLDKHQQNLTSLDEKRFLVFCLVLQDACDQTVLLPFFFFVVRGLGVLIVPMKHRCMDITMETCLYNVVEAPKK